MRIEGDLERIVDKLEKVSVRPVRINTRYVGYLLILPDYRIVALVSSLNQATITYALQSGSAKERFLQSRWT